MITEKDLERSKHISDKEVRQDIADTEAEIKEYERKIPAYETLGDKMSMFRAGGMRDGVKERKVFIQNLKDLLKPREETKKEKNENKVIWRMG